MSTVAAARAAWSVLRSPRIDRSALRRLQEHKLRRVVNHAWQHVPYYRRLFDRARVDPSTVRTIGDLSRLPVTSKKDLLEAGSDAFSRFYPPDKLVTHRTTGSTGEPMTMRFDRHFERVRSMVFLRALLAAGYRPGERLLMMKPGHSKRPPAWIGWEAVSFDESPEAMLERIGRTRPAMLYGWVTPIRELAVHMRNSGVRIQGLRAVVTTAETLDETTRVDLKKAFGADLYDFYGLTEMGTVAWECSRHDGLHVSEDVVHVEADRVGASGNEATMIMTSLELTAMPLIRYQTGDLAVSLDARPCACGRLFHRIRQVSGRMVDCLQLPGGQLLSPYSVTLALEPVQGLTRYQVLQEQPGSLLVRYEAAAAAPAMAVPEAIRSALVGLVGHDVRIETRREDSISPPSGRKFRVVESLIKAE